MIPRISIEKVSFSHGSRRVFHEVSLQFEKGLFYGILGPNGCGKTTLLDLMIRHQRPAKGSIFYENTPLNKFSRKELSKLLALVPQGFDTQFPFTAIEGLRRVIFWDAIHPAHNSGRVSSWNLYRSSS